MKTTKTIIAAFFALAFVSCAQEIKTPQEDVNAGDRITRFTAEGTDTKTGLSWNSESELMNVKWCPTDKINVNGSEFANTATEAAISAVFESAVGIEAAEEYIAVYPSTATVNQDGTISASLPKRQTAVASSFGDNLNVSVAKSATTDLSFKNVLGMLRFKITADNIYSVKITGNDNEYLAGDIKVSFDDEGNPVASVVENSNASKDVTIVSGSDTKVAIPKGTVVFALVAPQTFEKGITMTFTTVNYATDAVVKASKQGTAVKTSSTPLTVNPSAFKNLGDVGSYMNWYYAGVNLHSQFFEPTHAPNQGCYIDLRTCRTFYPIGAYAYCNNIDVCAGWTSGSNNSGHSLYSISDGKTWYDYASRIAAFNNNVAPADENLIANWESVRTTFFFNYDSNVMDDETFEALKVTGNPVDGVTMEFKDTDRLASNPSITGRTKTLTLVTTVSGGTLAVTKQYIGFKTQDNKYGVIKVIKGSGTTGQSFIQFDYIIGK